MISYSCATGTTCSPAPWQLRLSCRRIAKRPRRLMRRRGTSPVSCRFLADVFTRRLKTTSYLTTVPADTAAPVRLACDGCGVHFRTACSVMARQHWRRSWLLVAVDFLSPAFAGDKKSTATKCRLRLRRQCGQDLRLQGGLNWKRSGHVFAISASNISGNSGFSKIFHWRTRELWKFVACFLRGTPQINAVR